MPEEEEKKLNLKQRRPTLLGNIERGCRSEVLSPSCLCKPHMVWIELHQQNMSITSLWKRERYETETYLAQTQILYSGFHFTVWGRVGFKNLTSFFFSSIQLSKGSDSSYISHWIDLCFQQPSPLLVCWLVERWQIGFHSLHGGAQWSGFDRVKRNSASVPPPISLFLSAHTHTHSFLSSTLSPSPSLSLSPFPGA